MVYQTVVGGLVGVVVVGTSSVRCADVDTAWRSGRTKATCSFIAEVGFGWCAEWVAVPSYCGVRTDLGDPTGGKTLLLT